MTMYVVKKERGQWSVFAHDGAVVTFDSYSEAVDAAQIAATLLAKRYLAKRSCVKDQPRAA